MVVIDADMAYEKSHGMQRSSAPKRRGAFDLVDATDYDGESEICKKLVAFNAAFTNLMTTIDRYGDSVMFDVKPRKSRGRVTLTQMQCSAIVASMASQMSDEWCEGIYLNGNQLASQVMKKAVVDSFDTHDYTVRFVASL